MRRKVSSSYSDFHVSIPIKTPAFQNIGCRLRKICCENFSYYSDFGEQVLDDIMSPNYCAVLCFCIFIVIENVHSTTQLIKVIRYQNLWHFGMSIVAWTVLVGRWDTVSLYSTDAQCRFMSTVVKVEEKCQESKGDRKTVQGLSS